MGGGLDLSRGGSVADAGGPSAYAGGNVSLDDDPFADEVPAGSLELDLPPSTHAAKSSRSMPTAPEPPPDQEIVPPSVSKHRAAGAPKAEAPIDAQPAPAPAAASPGAARSPDPALLIAQYPEAPNKVWEAPRYAMAVLWRQYELRQDLASLRKRRSPDVPLYERALTVHDKKTFSLGLVIALAGFAVASFLFFLPVILRLLRDPE
jgi:hypothetical protein